MIRLRIAQARELSGVQRPQQHADPTVRQKSRRPDQAMNGGLPYRIVTSWPWQLHDVVRRTLQGFRKQICDSPYYSQIVPHMEGITALPGATIGD